MIWTWLVGEVLTTQPPHGPELLNICWSPFQGRAWRPSRVAADNQAAHDAAVLSEAQVGDFT